MAIWQLDFNLVPDDGENSMGSFSLNDNSLLLLADCLPQCQSHENDLMVFGDIDGTCVTIFYYNSKLDEIAVRLHVGALCKKQLDCILKFASINRLMISYNNQLITPTLEHALELIKESNAFRFVTNPQKFFEDLFASQE